MSKQRHLAPDKYTLGPNVFSGHINPTPTLPGEVLKKRWESLINSAKISVGPERILSPEKTLIAMQETMRRAPETIEIKGITHSGHLDVDALKFEYRPENSFQNNVSRFLTFKQARAIGEDILSIMSLFSECENPEEKQLALQYKKHAQIVYLLQHTKTFIAYSGRRAIGVFSLNTKNAKVITAMLPSDAYKNAPKGIAYLAALAIKPSEQETGMMTTICQKIEDILAQEGKNTIRLKISERIASLLESNGYKKLGYDAKEIEKQILEKRI